MKPSNVALVAPTLNAGGLWLHWMKSFWTQSVIPRHRLVIDSGSSDGTREIAEEHGFEVERIENSDFHHALTRQMAIDRYRQVEYRRVPDARCRFWRPPRALRGCFSRLTTHSVAIAFGRQLPRPGATAIEAHARLFNYPGQEQSCVLGRRL